MDRQALGPKLTAQEISWLLADASPQFEIGRNFLIEETRHGFARVRMIFRDGLLRPGGAISGPALFALADVAMYVAVLASLGAVTEAATANLNINFLRKAPARDMLGEASLLKLGKRLIVGEIALFAEGKDDLAAHATTTYSIPEREVS